MQDHLFTTYSSKSITKQFTTSHKTNYHANNNKDLAIIPSFIFTLRPLRDIIPWFSLIAFRARIRIHSPPPTTTTTPPRVQIITGSNNLLLQPPPPVLERHAHHVKHTLHRIANDPKPQRHRWGLFPAHRQHNGGDDEEREVPHEVEDDYRARVRPVALPLLDLLRRRLAHAPRRLARHAPAAGAAEEASCSAEARRAAHEPPPAAFGEKRRRVDPVGRRLRWPRRRHHRRRRTKRKP